jgi:hypothetical protein
VTLGITWPNDDQAATFWGLAFGVLSILTAVGFAQPPGQPTFPVTVDEQEQKFDTTRSPKCLVPNFDRILIL